MKKVYHLVVYIWNRENRCWYKFNECFLFKKKEVNSIKSNYKKMEKPFHYRYRFKEETYERR